MQNFAQMWIYVWLNRLLKLWKFYPSAAGDAGDIANVWVELYMLEAKPAKRA